MCAYHISHTHRQNLTDAHDTAGLMNLAVRQLLEQTAPEAGGHGVGAPGETSQADSDGDCVSAEEAQEEAQATELHVAAFRLAGERITDLLCAPSASAGAGARL